MILLRVLERIQRSSGIVDIVQSEWFPRIFCVEFSEPRSGANESFGMTAHFHSRPFMERWSPKSGRPVFVLGRGFEPRDEEFRK